MTLVHDTACAGSDTESREPKCPPMSMPDNTGTHSVDEARALSSSPKRPGLTTAQSLAVASQFGVSLAIGVGLGLLAGQWLDGQIHTGMLFTLLGVFTGLVAGIASVVALYRATLRSSELEWRGGSGGKGKPTRH
jgi:ATP synthase protein I